MTGNAPELITATMEQAAAMPCITTSAQGAAKKCAPSSRTWNWMVIWEMMRIVVDIYGEDTQGTKEAVAMLLEPLGRVRVISVITNGKEEKRQANIRMI
jgi:hypothetical protein